MAQNHVGRTKQHITRYYQPIYGKCPTPFRLCLQASLLGALSSANNPFIPGMNLSVGLAVAAKIAVEGEKRALLSMQVCPSLGRDY